MAKTRSLKIAAFLLVLTLVTSCYVGGTFAKYVVGSQAGASARVAKFGVGITANGSLFASEYASDTPGLTAIANSVVAYNGTDKLVAPGTKGNAVSFTLSGKPEVAVRVTYSAVGNITLDNWQDEQGNFYCPLSVKINGVVVDGHSYQSAQLFIDAINQEIAQHNKTYAPNTDLASEEADSGLSISWSWPFEYGGDENSDAVKTENNAKDTYLGNQAAADKAAVFSIQVSATVTQVD